MKSYCMSSGCVVSFVTKEPSICPKCSKPFSLAGEISHSPPTEEKPKIGKTEIEEFLERAKKNSKKKDEEMVRRVDDDEDEENLEDDENDEGIIDDDDEENEEDDHDEDDDHEDKRRKNSRRENKRGKASQIGVDVQIDQVNRQSISDIAVGEKPRGNQTQAKRRSGSQIEKSKKSTLNWLKTATSPMKKNA